jgi:hypothetical protein
MASTSFFSSSGTSSTLQTTFTASVEAAQAAQLAAEAAQALAQQAKTDAESANSTATNQATISSDHRLDAGKYAVNAANSSFALTSTNGGTSGLYSALHYSTLATASQSAASTSEGNASGSATASAASAVTAGHYAVKIDDVVPTTSDYSAKAWATNTIVDTSGGGSAKSWATKADSATVDGSEYSSKTYAIGGSLATGSAKNWALGGGSGFTTSTAVAGGVYSAKYYAEAAQSAASNAEGSLTSFQAVYLGSGSSDPSSGHTSGDIFFNNTVNKLKYYNGSAWVAIEASANNASEGFAIAMAAAL